MKPKTEQLELKLNEERERSLSGNNEKVDGITQLWDQRNSIDNSIGNSIGNSYGKEIIKELNTFDNIVQQNQHSHNKSQNLSVDNHDEECDHYVNASPGNSNGNGTVIRETLEEICNDLQSIQINSQHLHALHRFRRFHRKRDRDVVIGFVPRMRASIVNGKDVYYRYGKKEREAIACFDFLYNIPINDEIESCKLPVNETKNKIFNSFIDGKSKKMLK